MQNTTEKGIRRAISESWFYRYSGKSRTGKTTVARLMGKILKELDILDRSHK